MQLIGLNITNGRANGGGLNISGPAADVTLTDCSIYANAAEGGGLFGNGAAAYIDGSRVVLSSCRIFGNLGFNRRACLFDSRCFCKVRTPF